MDRSSDPSPFAWILGGALALAGLGAALVAVSRARRPDFWLDVSQAREAIKDLPAGELPADAGEQLEGHPS